MASTNCDAKVNDAIDRPCSDCPFRIRPGDEVFVAGPDGTIGNVAFPVLLVELDKSRVLVRGNKSNVWVPLDRARVRRT